VTNGVPTGWADLIEETSEKIFQTDPDYKLELLKEKFGTLRWHGRSSYEHGTPVAMIVGRLERSAEERSAFTCMECGMPGLLGVHDNLWSVFCPKHTPAGFVLADGDD
jgi:hypothetical protein